MRSLIASLAILAAASASAAHAQALQCAIPDRLPRPRPELPTDKEPQRILPIGSYTLAISWSPQHCAGRIDADDAFQCSGRDGRFGFVLHGLWPDGVGKTWPQYCRAAPLLPDATIRRNLCMTPSVQLLQHEWAKHGTCMTRKPDDYFAKARSLYTKIAFPDMRALTRRKTLTAGALASAIATANPGLRADMMRITTERKGGWLSEVWMCLDKRFTPVRCPAHQGGVTPRTQIRIKPVG